MASDISKVKVNYNYLNPYDNIYAKYENTPLFDKAVWDDVRVKGGNVLDAYTSMLQNQKDMPSLQSLNEMYGYDMMSPEDKLFTLYNVANKDILSSEDTRAMRYRKLYDAEGKETGKEEIGEMTDFEYNEYMLKQQKEYFDYEQEMKRQQEQKDAMSGWEKFWFDVGDVALHVGTGFVKAVTGAVDFLSKVFISVDYGVGQLFGKGEDEGGILFSEDANLREIWADTSLSQPSTLLNLEEWMQENERKYSLMTDIYGNTSGFGNMLRGSAESIGQILAAAAGGTAVAGIGSHFVTNPLAKQAIQKLSVLGNKVTFYSGMYTGRMEQSIANDYKNEVSVLEMLLVNAVRTGADYAIEELSGKLLGFNNVDRLQLGKIVTKKQVNPFVRIFISSMQEGLEEVVQDSVDWCISSFVDLMHSNTNAIYADNLTLEDLAWSFVGGALASVAIEGFTSVINKVKSNKQVKEFFNSVTDEDLIASNYRNIKHLNDVAKNAYDKAKIEYQNNLELYKGNQTQIDLSTAEFQKYQKAYNETTAKLNDAIDMIDARVEQRAQTLATADKNTRKSLIKSITDLQKVLIELENLGWKLSNSKDLQKTSKYIYDLLYSGIQMSTNLYNQMGSERFKKVETLMEQLKSMQTEEGATKYIEDKTVELNDQIEQDQDLIKLAKSEKQLTTLAASSALDFMKKVAKDVFVTATDLISTYNIDKKVADNMADAINESAKNANKRVATNSNVTKTLTKDESLKVAAIMDGNNEFKDSNGNIVSIGTEEGITEKGATNLKGIKAKYGFDIAITLDTKSVKGTNKAILVPIQMTENAPTDIITNLGVNEAINTMSAKMDAPTKQWIIDLWSERHNNKLNDEYTFEEVVAQILCNPDVSDFRYMLFNSDVNTVAWFMKLTEYFDINKREIKGAKDVAVATVLKQVIDKIKPVVYEYITQMPALDQRIERLIPKIFKTKQEQDKIKQSRYNLTIGQAIIYQDNVSKEELNKYYSIIDNRVNTLPTITVDDKKELIANLHSNVQNNRIDAMNILDEYYNNIFFGKYNDKIYPRMTDLKTMTLATWLKSKNLTLSYLLDADTEQFEQYTKDFEIFTASKYSLKPNLNSAYGLEITSLTDEKYKLSPVRTQSFTQSWYHKMYTKSFSKVLGKLLLPNNELMLDVASMDDILTEPRSYLTNDVCEDIIAKHKYLNIETVRRYLNDYLAKTYDGTGKNKTRYFITPNSFNQNILFAYNTVNDYVKKSIRTDNNLYEKYVKGKDGATYNLKEFILPSMLKGRLKDTKVVINMKQNTHYDVETNSIIIGESSFDKSSSFNNSFMMSLIHEVNHAIDLANGFLAGAAKVKLPKEVVADINAHLEESGNSKLSDKAMAYLYFNTGERNAFGQELKQDEYPIIAKMLPDGTIQYTFPWGAIAIVSGNRLISYNGKVYEDISLKPTMQEMNVNLVNGAVEEILPESEYQLYADKIKGRMTNFNKMVEPIDLSKVTNVLGYDLPSGPALSLMKTGDVIDAYYVFSQMITPRLMKNVMETFMRPTVDTLNDVLSGRVDYKYRKNSTIDEQTTLKNVKEFAKSQNINLNDAIWRLLAIKHICFTLDTFGSLTYSGNEEFYKIIQDYIEISPMAYEYIQRKEPRALVNALNESNEYTLRSLKAFWLWLIEPSGVTFEEFAYNPMPFQRYQDTDEVYQDDKLFVSSSLGLKNEFDESDDDTYMLFGAIRPIDTYGACVGDFSHEREFLIPQDYDFKSIHIQFVEGLIYTGENNISKNVLQNKQVMLNILEDYGALTKIDLRNIDFNNDKYSFGLIGFGYERGYDRFTAFTINDNLTETLSKQRSGLRKYFNRYFMKLGIDTAKGLAVLVVSNEIAENTDLSKFIDNFINTIQNENDTFYINRIVVRTSEKTIFDVHKDETSPKNLWLDEKGRSADLYYGKKHASYFNELKDFIVNDEIDTTKMNVSDITNEDYEQAKDYIKKIREARKDSRNVSFGKTDKDYGLPMDILKSMLEGKYSARQDTTYKAASKIVEIYERNIERQIRGVKRKESGETYSYGQLTKAKAVGTLAEYYIDRGKYANVRGLFSAGMKKFLYETDASQLDEKLVKLIRTKQITQRGIFTYFRDNYNTMNEYTFNAIRDAFFPKSFITNKNELNAIIDAAPQLYALGKSIMLSENADLIDLLQHKRINEKISTKKHYAWLIDQLKNIGTNADENFMDNFVEYTEKYAEDIDAGQLALSLMKLKRKTLGNLSKEAGKAGLQAIGKFGWKSRTEFGKFIDSLDKDIKGGEGDNDMLLADVIATERNEYDELGFNELQQEAIRTYKEEILPYDKELQNEDLSQEEITKLVKNKIDAFEDAIFKLSDAALSDYMSKLMMTIDVIEEERLSEYEKLIREKSKTKTVNRSQAYQVLKNYIRNTKQLSNLNKNTIRYMPDNVKQYLVENDRGYYTFNLGKIQSDNLSGEQINQLRTDLKQGLSVVKTMAQAGTQFERNLEKYAKETEKTKRQKEIIKELREQRDTAVENLAETKTKVKELNKELKHTRALLNEKGEVRYETKIKNLNITMTADMPIPQRLYDAINTHFDNEAVTKLRYAQDPTAKHTVITVDEFIANSAKVFAGISNDEAKHIIEFFTKSGLSVGIDLDSDAALRLSGVRNLVLATMLSYDKDKIISLDDETRKSAYALMEGSVSEAGRTLSQWQGIINKLHPSRILLNEFRKLWNIEFEEADVKNIIALAKTGHFDNVEKELLKMGDKLTEKMKGENEEHKARYVATQMVNFMKAMMLSSPRTWIRNQTSNAIITLTDYITKPFGNVAIEGFKQVRNALNKLFPKIGPAIQGYREGQINLSQKFNTEKENKLKRLRAEGKMEEARELEQEIQTDKEQAKQFADMFMKSPVYALLGDQMSRYNFQEHLTDKQDSNSDEIALIRLMAENTRVKIAQDLSWDPKLVKPLKKIMEKVGGEKAAANIPEGLIAFIWKMNSDSWWINKRAKEYLENLIIQNDLSSTLSEFISNKATSSANLFSLALTNEKFANAVSDALSYAAYEYMHRRNFWTDIRSYLHREYPNIAIGVDLFMPFLSGGWNWFLDSMKRNPIGLGVSLIRYANLDTIIENNKRKLDRYQRNVSHDRPGYDPKFTEYTIRNDVGKGLWGTVCWIVGALLAHFGFIKKDDDDKYKLTIGNVKFDLSYVFGTEPLFMGAATVGSIRDRDTFLNIIDAALSTTLEDFFLTNWINSIKYGDTFVDILLDKMFSVVGSFVPNSWKAFTRIINNGKVKYDKSILGDLEYWAYTMLPGAINFLPKKIDPYTGEVEVSYSDKWWINLINESGIFAGIKFKTVAPSNLENKLSEITYTDDNGNEIKVSIGQLTGKYDDVGQLNKQVLNTYYGQLNNKYITDFLNNKVAYDVIDEKTNKKVTRKYSQMTDKQRINVINRIKSQNSKYAKIAAWVSSGNDYFTTKEERTALAKVGITKNIYIANSKKNGFVE